MKDTVTGTNPPPKHPKRRKLPRHKSRSRVNEELKVMNVFPGNAIQTSYDDASTLNKAPTSETNKLFKEAREVDQTEAQAINANQQKVSSLNETSADVKRQSEGTDHTLLDKAANAMKITEESVFDVKPSDVQNVTTEDNKVEANVEFYNEQQLNVQVDCMK